MYTPNDFQLNGKLINKMGNFVLIKEKDVYKTGYLWSYLDGPKNDDMYVIKPSEMIDFRLRMYNSEMTSSSKYSITNNLVEHFNTWQELNTYCVNNKLEVHNGY